MKPVTRRICEELARCDGTSVEIAATLKLDAKDVAGALSNLYKAGHVSRVRGWMFERGYCYLYSYVSTPAIGRPRHVPRGTPR